MRCFWNALAVFVCLSVSSLVGTPTADAADRAGNQQSKVSEPTPASLAKNAVAEYYGNLPLSFEANQGQTDGQVRFLSRGSGYSFFLTRNSALLTFTGDAHSDSTTLHMELEGTSPNAQIRGLGELPGKSNYFLGNDAQHWRTSVPAYAKVAYDNIYPGINLVYYGSQRQLEYDFVLSPGADAKQIRLAVSGAQKVSVDSQGNLVLHSRAGDVQLLAPKVYQEIKGQKHIVAGQWILVANNAAGFRIGDYDHAKALIIDPVLQYSSFLGGSQKNALTRVAIDASGNAYVAGYTTSGDFPAAPTPMAQTFGNGTPSRGAFVAKIDPTGSTLLYSTYLSGSVDEEATGLAVDSAGNVYVAGTTHSPDFPTRNALQPTCPTHTQAGTCSSAFLTKISPSGDSLLFSSYMGGSGGESARGLAVDAVGGAYVVGVTSSVDFPVTAGAAQPKCGGTCQQNAFVAKYSAAGDRLAYATYLGGSGTDDSADVAVDASGSAYIAGHTTSPDFPAVSAFQKSCAPDPLSSSGACVATGFVTKLKADGSAFLYSSYLGGTLGGQVTDIAVDSQGSAYVTGSTVSADFPVVNPYQKSCAKDAASGLCSVDAFVTKFAPSGKTLVYSTYLGGSGKDEASGIAVDAAGNAHIVGRTESTDFPAVAPMQKQLKGASDAFVARLNAAGSALSFSTYHGGSAIESGNGMALDTKGNVYVTGTTSSPDFPTLHPFQPSCTGTCTSAFVSKLALPAPPALVVTITNKVTARDITQTHTFNATSDANGVTWSISGSGCTPLPACLGSLSASTITSVDYTAPNATTTTLSVTITATSITNNTVSDSDTFPVTDFTLSVPATANVLQGQTLNLPAGSISGTAIDGFSNTVTISCSETGGGTGITCTPAGTIVPGTSTTTASLAASASATTGVQTVAFSGSDTGSGGALTNHATQNLSLTVCSVAFSGTTPPANVNADASSGNNFTVTLTGGSCDWTASSDQTWLTISPASGTGTGTATWGVTANTGNSARTGHITIAGTTFTVTQAAVSVSVAPTSATVEVGQTRQFTATVNGATDQSVTWSLTCTTTPCGTLTPNNTANPVTYNAPAPTDPNTNPGAVVIKATSNADNTKNGTSDITIDDFSLSLSATTATAIQGLAATPSPVLTVTAVNGYTGTVQPGCTGTPAGVTCSASSVTNSGTSTITINTSATSPVGASSGMKITGTDAAGNPVTHNLAFTLTVCSVSFTNPPPTNVTADGTSGTVTVTITGGNCAWTTATDASAWLHISAGSAGSGTANFTVDPNTGATATAARTGHLTIAGQVFTVNQSVTSVSVAPTNPSIEVGQSFTAAPGPFTATVTGATDVGVTWSLQCTGSCGSVNSTTANPVTYTAPAPVLLSPTAAQGPVTIKATSHLDNTKSASTSITITDFGLALSSASADIAPGQSSAPTVTASPINGYSGTTFPTTLCSVSPVVTNGPTCSLASSLSISTATPVTLSTTSNTPPSTYTITVDISDSAASPVKHEITFTLHVVVVSITTPTTFPATIEVNQTVALQGSTAGLPNDNKVNWTIVGTNCNGNSCGTFGSANPNTSTTYISPASSSPATSLQTAIQVRATSNGDNGFNQTTSSALITDYSLSLPGSAAGINQNPNGATGSSTLTGTWINGYAGALNTPQCVVSPVPANGPSCAVNAPPVSGTSSSSPVAITTQSNTPVGLYTMQVNARDQASNPQSRSTNAQSLAVLCGLTVNSNQMLPAFVPALSSSDGKNQFTFGVAVNVQGGVPQGGAACPYGTSLVTGVNTSTWPVTNAGAVNVLLSGSGGVSTSTTPGVVTFETAAGTTSLQQGTVTVPYFNGNAAAGYQGTLTMPVAVEPEMLQVAQPLSQGVEQAQFSLSASQSGTLVIPSTTVCGAVSLANNIPYSGITCTASGSQITVHALVPQATAMLRHERTFVSVLFAFFLPAIVVVGSGFSAFGRGRSQRKWMKRTVCILIVMSLLVMLSSCGGGFNAAALQGTGTGKSFVVTVMGYTTANNAVQGIEIFTIQLTL